MDQLSKTTRLRSMAYGVCIIGEKSSSPRFCEHSTANSLQGVYCAKVENRNNTTQVSIDTPISIEPTGQFSNAFDCTKV